MFQSKLSRHSCTLLVALSCGLILTAAGCGKPTQESLAKDMHGKFKDMVGLLKGVTDEASAKSTGPKLRAKMEEMSALKKQFDELLQGKTDAEKATALADAQKLMAQQMDDQKEFMGELMRISAHKTWMEPIEEAMKGLKME